MKTIPFYPSGKQAVELLSRIEWNTENSASKNLLIGTFKKPSQKKRSGSKGCRAVSKRQYVVLGYPDVFERYRAMQHTELSSKDTTPCKEGPADDIGVYSVPTGKLTDCTLTPGPSAGGRGV